MASPLQKYENSNRERWKVVHDIPPWILDSITIYIESIFFDVKNDNVVQTIQRGMRMMLPDYCRIDYTNRRSFSQALEQDGDNGCKEMVLPLLDLAVKYIRDYAPRQLHIKKGYDTHNFFYHDLLDGIDSLLRNGSKWRVLRDRNSESGLIERVNPEITKIAQNIDNDFLTKAWNQAFQRQPDPENAVMSAQKAIESIASDRGLTSATSKVYGALLGDIKANPTLYFSKARDAYDLQNVITKQSKDESDINGQFAEWFANGMDLIQKTNPARHSSGITKDFKLSAEAAQQVVVIATMLVWFIESGSFQRMNKESRA